MGDCVGDYNGELFSDNFCKIIERGELVEYYIENGKLMKKVYPR